jgi:hypothetical protein
LILLLAGGSSVSSGTLGLVSFSVSYFGNGEFSFSHLVSAHAGLTSSRCFAFRYGFQNTDPADPKTTESLIP